jgi:hypothetical protein
VNILLAKIFGTVKPGRRIRRCFSAAHIENHSYAHDALHMPTILLFLASRLLCMLDVSSDTIPNRQLRQTFWLCSLIPFPQTACSVNDSCRETFSSCITKLTVPVENAQELAWLVELGQSIAILKGREKLIIHRPLTLD